MFRDQLSDFVGDLKNLFVGDRTIGDTLFPPIVFVIAQRPLGVGWGAALALAVASVFVGWRWAKSGSIAYAPGPVATVGLAAFFAVRSGEAEDFFIPGIVSAFLWAAAGTVSIMLRRPFVAFASAFYRKWLSLGTGEMMFGPPTASLRCGGCSTTWPAALDNCGSSVTTKLSPYSPSSC